MDLLIGGCGWSSEDAMAMPLALAHASGLFMMVTNMQAGARFVLLESFDAAAVLGQRVFGFVKLARGQRPEVVLDILDRLSTRLAGYKVPEQLFVLDALPRNALSKVDRKTLQSMAAGPDW
jgi:acyl-CoA synthetase (AMP-forming)/AMP-acid ligase II